MVAIARALTPGQQADPPSIGVSAHAPVSEADRRLFHAAAIDQGDPVLAVDLDGEPNSTLRVLWANPAAQELLEREADTSSAHPYAPDRSAPNDQSGSAHLAGQSELDPPEHWTRVAVLAIAAARRGAGDAVNAVHAVSAVQADVAADAVGAPDTVGAAVAEGDTDGDPDDAPGRDPSTRRWHLARLGDTSSQHVLVSLRIGVVDAATYLVWLRPVTRQLMLAREAAEVAEHRFTALGENAPIGIIVSEIGLRLGFVNDSFAGIAGVARENLLGTNWLGVIHPEDLPALMEMLDRVLDATSAESTLRVLSTDGSHRWVLLRLAPVITRQRAAGFVGTVQDITARRAWEAQLTYQAGHDSLTGLANRRSLTDTLTDLFASRRRRDRDTAVLFCDLDGFKDINDTHGHDAGDRVLIEVARRLSATARDHDLVARIAGDEFVVVLRQIGGFDEAEAAASRQLAALSVPHQVAGTLVHVSASIGIAVAWEHESPTSLLHAADRGMYEAKRSGKGVYRRIAHTATSWGPSA